MSPVTPDRSPAATPSAAEFGALMSWLAARGYGRTAVTAALGGAPEGRSRREIAAALRAWLATRPTRG